LVNLRGRGHLEHPDLDWRIILRWIFSDWGGGMYWTDLAQDRDRWRELVSSVINFRVLLNAGNFLTSRETVTFSRRTLVHGVSTTGVV